MCDTLCVLPGAAGNPYAMLAKNSDREPNEPHVITYVPVHGYAAGEKLKCTYIEIPQAPHTNAVLLFKPDWIWGAEMGVNEYGVAIGNEAVFTKAKKGPDALTGMDLLRLALERSVSAEAALKTIVSLLREFGQGGNCGYSKDFRYDNSFLIADKKTAFVLETSGRNWAAEEVRGKAAISNRLFMHGTHTMREGLIEGEDFANRYTEPLFSFFSQAKHRRSQSLCALESSVITPESLINALRTHAPKVSGHEFSRGSVGSVCMHAGSRIGDQTTGSFVAVLREGAPMTIWATGASVPCISAFKPVFFGISVPPVFEDEEKGRGYWLKREKIHRAVLAGRISADLLREKLGALEKKWLAEEEKLFSAGIPDTQSLKAFALRAAAEEEEVISGFDTENWNSMSGGSYFSRFWRKENEALGKGR